MAGESMATRYANLIYSLLSAADFWRKKPRKKPFPAGRLTSGLNKLKLYKKNQIKKAEIIPIG